MNNQNTALYIRANNNKEAKSQEAILMRMATLDGFLDIKPTVFVDIGNKIAPFQFPCFIELLQKLGIDSLYMLDADVVPIDDKTMVNFNTMLKNAGINFVTGSGVIE